MTKNAVEVRNVAKRFRMYHERNQTLKSMVMRGRRASYEDFWALEDITFDVPQGTTLGLIGSNGSGKSTLLKCLANIYYPDRGSISHHGRLAAMLEVGSGFHLELSGMENIYLNGSILGMKKRDIDARLDEIITFSGVERFIDQPVKNYSSGMYVRLGFSIAINVDPDILVVDEVLAVGDADFQAKCFDKFGQLHSEGKTVILVSHSMGIVERMCDQAVWLDNGALRAAGPASETIAAYKASLGHEK